MLPSAIVQEIRRLLDERRWSQRQIARRLAVSRGIVSAIANGRRGLFGRDPEEVAPPGPRPTSLAARCLSCGGMVFRPCRLCAVRAFRERAAAEAARVAAANRAGPPGSPGQAGESDWISPTPLALAKAFARLAGSEGFR